MQDAAGINIFSSMYFPSCPLELPPTPPHSPSLSSNAETPESKAINCPPISSRSTTKGPSAPISPTATFTPPLSPTDPPLPSSPSTCPGRLKPRGNRPTLLFPRPLRLAGCCVRPCVPGVCVASRACRAAARCLPVWTRSTCVCQRS
jgi:hypothetical protein